MAVIACSIVQLPKYGACVRVYVQRICQREGARGEQERVPEAQKTAAD